MLFSDFSVDATAVTPELDMKKFDGHISKVFETLGIIVQNIDNIPKLESTAKMLGLKHTFYHVQPQHLPVSIIAHNLLV